MHVQLLRILPRQLGAEILRTCARCLGNSRRSFRRIQISIKTMEHSPHYVHLTYTTTLIMHSISRVRRPTTCMCRSYGYYLINTAAEYAPGIALVDKEILEGTTLAKRWNEFKTAHTQHSCATKVTSLSKTLLAFLYQIAQIGTA